MNLRLLAFLLLALAPLTTVFGGESTEVAQKRLETAVNDVLEIADHATNNTALASALRPVLTKYISFEAMTRRAVGPGWKQFSGDQQKKATQLFTTLIIRSYSSKFTPGERPVIKYKAATSPAPGRVEVPTTLLYQGSQYNVIYRMESGEGWKITDVVIEGVSMIANYRGQFDAEYKKGGAEAVVAALSQSVGQQ